MTGQHHEGIERLVHEEGTREEMRRGVRPLMRSAFDFRSLRRSPYGLMPIVVLATIGFFQEFDSQAFNLAGPDIARDLHINVGDIISIVALVSGVAILATLYAGWWADRHRRTPFIGIGTIVSGIGAMLGGRAHSFATASYPRVIDEAANTAADVPSFALLADYYPVDRRGKVFALLGILGSGAALVSPFAVGWALVHYGWKSTLFACGVPLVLMGVVSLLVLREPVRGYMEKKALGLDDETARIEDEPQSFAEGLRATWAVRTLRRVFFASIASNAYSAALSIFVPFWLASMMSARVPAGTSSKSAPPAGVPRPFSSQGSGRPP
jgi:MFS family permease